jgi:branched-chain amino acid transport system ATP-binding protein
VIDSGEIVYEGSAAALASDEARVQALAGVSAEEWSVEDAPR